MKQWIKSWRKSKKPKKQHKYIAQAPLHIKGDFLASHVSKELRQKYKRRSLRVKKGDKVKIMRGNFKGKIGKVERVDIKATKVYVLGIEVAKKDGSKSLYPIHPSNLLIQELVLDKKRLGEKQ